MKSSTQTRILKIHNVYMYENNSEMLLLNGCRSRPGPGRMLVGFKAVYAISSYRH